MTGSAQCGLAPYWAKKLGKCDLSAYAVLLFFFFSSLQSSLIGMLFLIVILNLWVAFEQASARGGIVHVHVDEQRKRILMQGKAVMVMEGCLLI